MSTSDGGDSARFEAAYREHFVFAWRALRRLGVPERDLNDATQDVFVVVHRKLPAFDFVRPLKTWVYAICLRVASERRRSAVQRNELLAASDDPSETRALSFERGALTDDEAERQRNAERRALLELALSIMSGPQRAVFTLFELEGQTGEEVASLLGIPLATVYSRLRLARQSFRSCIERERARDALPWRRTGGER